MIGEKASDPVEAAATGDAADASRSSPAEAGARAWHRHG